MLNIICETSAILRIIHLINVLKNILFIVTPIGLVVVSIFKFFKSITNPEKDSKELINSLGKKIIAIVCLFLVPVVINIVVSFLDEDSQNIYKNCMENATIEKINYYIGVEEEVLKVEEIVKSFENYPTDEKLVKAQEAVSSLYGIANGEIIQDLEYKIAKATNKLSESKILAASCSNNGGVWKYGSCIYRSSDFDTSRGSSTISSGQMVYYSFNSTNDYKVVNTKLSVKSYISTMQSKRICQKQNNGTVYNDQCLCFAEEHLHALVTGNTSKSASSVKESYYSGFVKSYDNDSKTEVLKVIYNNLINNKPVILQVNGNKAGTSRHYVAVIGFKSSVKNASSLKDSDLLLIDSYDCKVEALTSNDSRRMVTGSACKKSYSGYQIYSLI